MRVRVLLLVIALAAAISLAACSGQGMPGPALLDAWGETGKGPGELLQPTGIAVSKDGTVFVADTGNNRIQAFTSDGQLLWQFGRAGEAAGEFRRPMDLDLDGDGLLYVAELGGDRVQIFTPSEKSVPRGLGSSKSRLSLNSRHTRARINGLAVPHRTSDSGDTCIRFF